MCRAVKRDEGRGENAIHASVDLALAASLLIKQILSREKQRENDDDMENLFFF